MAILSNYTPNCLVKTWVECDIKDLGTFDDGMTAEVFAQKFAKSRKSGPGGYLPRHHAQQRHLQRH